MNIDPDGIRRLAHLACLRIEDGEAERLAGDLERIVRFMDDLAGVDLPPTTPAACPFDSDVHREDRPGECLSVEEALANAPESDGTYFLTPRVVDRERA